MNDQQVKQQIQQMVSFIRQEAEEKANEIRVKAEEDFNIRKLTNVEAAREKIRAEYEKKSKRIEVNQRIARSTELNASRLKLLRERDHLLREVYNDADKRIAALPAAEPTKYKDLLHELILQGLLVLSDPEVLIRCRPEDLSTVQKILPKVKSDYESKTGLKVNVSTDQKAFLSDVRCTGGVSLLSHGGKIQLDNTFESRLETSYQQNLPKIRKMLFADIEEAL